MIRSRMQQGFSLLEVMIAVVVLSVGLLGLAALQGYTIRNNQSANYRTHATNLAYQFMDMAKSYRGAGSGASAGDARNHPNVRRLVAGLSNFTQGTFASVATDCQGASPDALRCDRARWFSALRTHLPGAMARVTFQGLPSGELTVEICWTDDRSQSSPTVSTNCTGASEGLGQPSPGPDGVTNWANNAVWVRSQI